jgi:GNAT superfamily N-acetyltransferase
MGSAPQVLPLQKEDVEVAGRVIARAFHEDELTVHLYPDSQTRSRFAPAMFEALVRYDQLFGQVDHLAGCTAVASWMRPGETVETPERLAQAGFDGLPDDVPLETLDAVFGYIGSVIATAAPEPHWHLRLLGVEPGHQGGGLGAVVMRHGIERAAQTDHAVVLETFSERAVPFYLRNGFEILVDQVEPTSGLRFLALCHRPHQ